MPHDFVIQKWASWPPLDDESESCADQESGLLASIPKMLRRRLSPLARTVFCAARQCIDGDAVMPLVFSSAHGELEKTFTMMKMLEFGEEISPTAFSLSVHNAIAGLFSMASLNRLENTAIAPGEEGMAPAFLEALGLLAEGAKQILVAFYDEPIVSFYPTAPYRLSTDRRFALALRIGASGEGLPLRLTAVSTGSNDGEQPLQLLAFIQFLEDSRSSLTFGTSRHGWRFEKNVQTD
ncbi:MAG: beta-ketoacyl synthase chain length factor [Gammaproteobacteria bacterium]